MPLPERWLKGFADVQAAVSRMVLRQELTAIEARRFLQSLPRGRSRGLAWATPAGTGLRLASRAEDASVCLAGPERLRLLEKLMPFARALRIYGPLCRAAARAGPSRAPGSSSSTRPGWCFVVSPEPFRGFLGEGGVLADLAAADEDVVERLVDGLHGQSEIGWVSGSSPVPPTEHGRFANRACSHCVCSSSPSRCQRWAPKRAKLLA